MNNLIQIVNLAKVKSIDLRKQREDLWGEIYKLCESNSDIYEYNILSDITLICKNAKETANIISKDLNKKYKYITIHNYLKGKENIISLNGEKIIYIYEDEINDKNEAKKRLFYLSRFIYNPSVFLDIIKYKTAPLENKTFNEAQLTLLNDILNCFKLLCAKEDINIKLGARSKNIIVKKHITNNYNSREEEKDIKSFIIKNMSIENNNGLFAVSSNKEGPIVASSNYSWDFIKKIKTLLNKSKFNAKKHDRFYYEINKTYIYNDFRLMQLSLVDRKNNNVLLRLFNNLEYEAIPVIIKQEGNFSYYIMHHIAEIRFKLYDIIFNKQGNENSKLVEILNTFKYILSKCDSKKETTYELFYIGQYIDDKVEKIKLGGSMKRL